MENRLKKYSEYKSIISVAVEDFLLVSYYRACFMAKMPGESINSTNLLKERIVSEDYAKGIDSIFLESF